MSRLVALVTYQDKSREVVDSESSDSDSDASDASVSEGGLLQEPVSAYGIKIEEPIWDDNAVDWSGFSLIVIRSTWDYHKRVKEFLKWISRVECLGIPIYNQPEVVRWNSDKIYLKALSENGVNVIPTAWGNKDMILAHVLQENGWDEVVIKPRHGASGEGVWTYNKQTDPFDSKQSLSNMIIQPKMVEILEGEYSLLFFNNVYSHTVLKTPRDGCLISSKGKIKSIEPPLGFVEDASSILQLAAGILKIKPEDFLYARVDCINVDGKLTLMELELIEPGLYLNHCDKSTKAFAGAIAKKLGIEEIDDTTGNS